MSERQGAGSAVVPVDEIEEVLEEYCSSYCLDNVIERRKVARHLAAWLSNRCEMGISTLAEQTMTLAHKLAEGTTLASYFEHKAGEGCIEPPGNVAAAIGLLLAAEAALAQAAEMLEARHLLPTEEGWTKGG